VLSRPVLRRNHGMGEEMPSIRRAICALSKRRRSSSSAEPEQQTANAAVVLGNACNRLMGTNSHVASVGKTRFDKRKPVCERWCRDMKQNEN